MASTYIIVVMAARNLEDTQYLLMWDFSLNPPSDLECQVALLQDKEVETALVGMPDLVEPPPKEELVNFPESQLSFPAPPVEPSHRPETESDDSQDSISPLDKPMEIEDSSSDSSFEDLEGEYLQRKEMELLEIKFEVARTLNDIVSHLCD